MRAVVVIIILAVIALLGWANYALVPESKAIHAVENMGYSNVHVVDKSFALPFSGCSEEDEVVFTVRGTLSGVTRDLEVCAALIKGATVRSN